MSTPDELDDEVSKSRRPKDTKFKQQKLPAWQPILTAGTVLPAFFAIGIAFIPLGVALLVTSNNVQEVSLDYTHCSPSGSSQTCADFLKDVNNTGKVCTCTRTFNLTEPFRGDVYMYYGLTNFYQNHRRYVKARDDSQLVGDVKSMDKFKKNRDCLPLRTWSNGSVEIRYAPCGAIANSMFNDSFSLSFHGEQGTAPAVNINLLKNNIAWSTDKNVKFNNPPGANLSEAFKDTVKPPNWPKPVYELDTDDPSNNGFKNEDFIVWMRTSALPNFRKLYRRIDHSQDYLREGLPAGMYSLNINYAYPVAQFSGQKKVILSTTSWMGGKNPFLGIAYLVVGSICIILGIVFLIIHLKIGKRPQDLINITNRTSY